MSVSRTPGAPSVVSSSELGLSVGLELGSGVSVEAGVSDGGRFYGRLTNRYNNIFLILTGLVVWLHYERTRFRPGSVFPKSMLLHANDAECKEGAAGVP